MIIAKERVNNGINLFIVLGGNNFFQLIRFNREWFSKIEKYVVHSTNIFLLLIWIIILIFKSH